MNSLCEIKKIPPPPKSSTSNSGSQVGKDVMTAAAVWSQLFTLSISASVKSFLFLTNNHFD